MSAAQWATIRANALAWEAQKLEATRAAVETWADETVAWERENAPWEDQTGDARRQLDWVAAHPGQLGGGAAVRLVHGVSYGERLEFDFGGRYAIIGPALAVRGPQLLARLREIWV